MIKLANMWVPSLGCLPPQYSILRPDTWRALEASRNSPPLRGELSHVSGDCPGCDGVFSL